MAGSGSAARSLDRIGESHEPFGDDTMPGMRIRLVTSLLMFVFLTACGQQSLGGVGSLPVQTGANGDLPAPPSSEPAGNGNGSVDCATIKTAAQQLLAIQFLAQLTTPETIEAIKSKQIGNLDLDAFLAGMHDLHALDSHSSPLGDPKAAIDFYEEAGKAAQTLFGTEPVTQAAIDTYSQKVGTVDAFLSHQIAISGAMSAAGC